MTARGLNAPQLQKMQTQRAAAVRHQRRGAGQRGGGDDRSIFLIGEPNSGVGHE